MKKLSSFLLTGLLCIIVGSALANNPTITKLRIIKNVGGGADVCASSGYPTCIPVVNSSNSNSALVTFQGYGSRDVPAGEGVILAGSETINSVNVTVNNDSTGAQIYQGSANNYVGLICTATDCEAWN